MRGQRTVVTLVSALAVTSALPAAPQGNPEAAKVGNGEGYSRNAAGRSGLVSRRISMMAWRSAAESFV